MDRPLLETIEKKSHSENPILIIDSDGEVGAVLADKVKEYTFTVFVSRIQKKYEEKEALYMPYSRKLAIPQAPYSHIIVIFSNDKEIKKYIQMFVREAKNIGARLVLVVRKETTMIDFIEKNTFEYRRNSVILVLGDLFSKTKNINFYLDNLIDELKTYQQVTVSSIGLSLVNPVLLEDTLNAILEVSLSNILPDSPNLLFQKEQMTVLSFLHILQKVNPSIRIDFSNKEEKKPWDIPKGSYFFSQNYSIEEKIREAYNLKSPGVKEKIRKFVAPNLVSKSESFLHLCLSTALFIFLLPIVLCALFSLLGVLNLKLSIQAEISGNMEKAVREAGYGTYFFSLARNFVKPVEMEFSYIGIEDKAVAFDLLIQKGEEASEMTSSIAKSVILYKDVIFGKSQNSQVSLSKATEELKNVLYLYSLLSTQGQIDKKADYFSNLLSNTVEILPSLLGANTKKTYLVLFQNNMELRPGGGFIGSYGLIKFDHAKLVSFSIHDVYDADGQLKGHIEPPFPIRRYIPMVHWYLRDSNFDVDFSNDAKNAALFLKEETGESVDGVIGIDVTSVKYLLDAIGPVDVLDYGERATGDNFYLLTQKHAEQNFFPGSTQKKDFLRSLFTAIEGRLSDGKKISFSSLLIGLRNALDEKHILIAFSEPSIQQAFVINDLSSSLLPNHQEKEGNWDFLGINEANLGTNKANYFIKRRVVERIAIGKDGALSHKMDLSYFNGSDTWPGGDYKVYIRIILPIGTDVSSIAIDGVEQALIPAVTDFAIYEKNGFTPPDGFEVDKYDQEGKSIFGFLITMPKQKFTSISLSYKTQPLDFSSSLVSYNLDLFKQPGTDNYPMDVGLSVDPSISMLSKPYEFNKTKQGISLSEKFQKDQSFSVEMSQK